MSDDEEIDLEALANSIDEPADKGKTDDKPAEKQSAAADERTYEEKQEDKARSGGWKPLEEWEGDEDDWVDSRDFNSRQGLIGEMRGLKRKVDGYDQRIDNLNQVHAGQMEAQRKDLVAQRDKAILEGGQRGLEVAKNKQYQIDTMAQQANFVPPQAADPVQSEWEGRNAWINEDSPKGAYGREMWAKLGQQGHTSAATAIPALEAAVAKQFPAGARSKPTQSEAETGSKPTGFKRQAQKLTMADVTTDERKMLDAMPGAWANKTEAEILQAVKDSRGAK